MTKSECESADKDVRGGEGNKSGLAKSRFRDGTGLASPAWKIGPFMKTTRNGKNREHGRTRTYFRTMSGRAVGE